MTNSKLFVWFALAAGMVLPGASTLSAQDWRGAPPRAELRNDHRDIARDRIRLEQLRAEVARDEVRLRQAIRRGRSREIARISAELTRDRQALRAQMTLMRLDRLDAAYDRRDVGPGYRDNRDPRYVNR